MISENEIVPVILISILGTGFVTFLLLILKDAQREYNKDKLPDTKA